MAVTPAGSPSKSRNYDPVVPTKPLDFMLLFCEVRVSLVAQSVKCLPAMQETRVRSLAPKDPLEEEMATHSSIRPWKIPWIEEPSRL